MVTVVATRVVEEAVATGEVEVEVAEIEEGEEGMVTSVTAAEGAEGFAETVADFVAGKVEATVVRWRFIRKSPST